MFNNRYRLGVGLMTLLVLGLGRATPAALADGGMVVVNYGGFETYGSCAALDPLTGDIVVTGLVIPWSMDTLAVSVLPTGDLNTAFGGGIIVTDVGKGFDDASYACAVQADGKVLSGGWVNPRRSMDFALVRYNANGTLDKTFNKTGIVKTDFRGSEWINAMVLQADGKILVTGAKDGSIITARYTTSGKLDSTFGSGGSVITTVPNKGAEGTCVALHSSGILVGAIATAGGADTMVLVRYKANGSPDTSFGNGGIAMFVVPGADGSSLRQIAVDSDNSIVAAGESFVYHGTGANDELTLVRFTANGILDGTFGEGDGYITFWLGAGDYYAHSIALQPDGKIVTTGRPWVARFNWDGTLDATFNGIGFAHGFPGAGSSVLLQPDGKIVAAGTMWDFAAQVHSMVIVRYLPDGTPDEDF